MSQIRIILITLFALLAFAGNSLITRFALENTAIDEASFTLFRITSGAIFLWLYISFDKRDKLLSSGRWLAALALFLYVSCFTYGYRLVTAGTGALLVFGSVQITMTISGYCQGERLNTKQILGFGLAFLGLIILMLPGFTSPSLIGASLMCIAGIAWGFYTLQGQDCKDPSTSTTGNFIKAVPMAILFWLLVHFATNKTINLNSSGIMYALISGSITSGLGYIIWYSILPVLKSSQAAIVQLSVPIIVTLTGALLLEEQITLRVLLASSTILIGILLVLKFKSQ